MSNPYEVIGVPQGASKDEISHAYKLLVKKYHPDQYGNNPLKDLAEEKLKEINEAYDYLMKNTQNNNYQYSESPNREQNYNRDEYSDYSSIRMDINNGNFSEAERKLNSLRSRDAEWNYLMGIVSMKKGWYDAAYNNINTACSLDPSNLEYREALNKIKSLNNSYRQPYKTRSDSNFCDTCATLYCLDCLCESMGGDCIPCC